MTPSQSCALLMHALAPFALFLFAAASPAQALVRDINTSRSNDGSLLPIGGVVHQGVYYFSGTRYDTGGELWRSDGTGAGSYLVADLVPGPTGSFPQYFSSNGTLIFLQADSRVWRSDGTTPGTYALSPSSVANDVPPVIAGSGVVWGTRNGSIYTLWGSDGTNPTPVALRTMSSIGTFAASGSRTYFAAADAANGWELYFTDGTVAGTVMIDTVPGTGGITPTNLCSDGAGGVWFGGRTNAAGVELWHSDGTVAGTAMVVDALPGSAGTSPRNLCALGSRVLFAGTTSSLGEELWVSDGTPAGTTMVSDLWPGNTSGSPSYLAAVPALNRVFLSATDATAGREPWTTDGTAAGTYRLADLAAGSAGSNSGYDLGFGYSGGFVYFGATTPALGWELYKTDGTQAGTGLVADLYPGTTSSQVRFLADLAGVSLFQVYADIGTELWRLQPPASAPSLVANLNPPRPEGSFPSYQAPAVVQVAALDGRQHFAAYSPSIGTEPFVHAGTTASTVMVGDVIPGPAGRARLLTATSTNVYYEEWDTYLSGTARLVAVPITGAPVILGTGPVLGYAVLRDRLLFAQYGVNSEPRITDGTVAGTHVLADVWPGTTSSLPDGFATLGDRVFFCADDGVSGRELWVTDGTTAGTSLAVDIVAGPIGSDPRGLVAGQTLLYFRDANGVVGVTDGTAAGTVSLPGMPVNDFRETLGDLLIAKNDNQLWRSDGTTAGTFLLAQSDSMNYLPMGSPCVVRHRAFFTKDRLNAPPELWVTDGTVGGTILLRTLTPTPNAAAKAIGPAGLGHVACSITTAGEGAELWVSDGTLSGTVLAWDAEPGPAPSDPAFARGDTSAGGRFTWWPDTTANGREPWSMPLSAFGGSDFDRFGVGCAGSRGVPHIRGGGLPVLGSARMAYVLEGALPNSFGYLVLGFSRVPGPTPCVQRTSGEILVGIFSDAHGRAEHAFPVPTDLGLLSLTISGQFLVLDPQGLAMGLASATAGLEALIGR